MQSPRSSHAEISSRQRTIESQSRSRLPCPSPYRARDTANPFGWPTEVFSPGFAVHGRAGEASLQVSAMSQRSVECRLAGACSEELRSKSLTTRCRPGQRRRSQRRPGALTDDRDVAALPDPAQVGQAAQPIAQLVALLALGALA